VQILLPLGSPLVHSSPSPCPSHSYFKGNFSELFKSIEEYEKTLNV